MLIHIHLGGPLQWGWISHRKLAAPLQRRQAARLARIPGARTRGHRARARRVAGSATPTGSAGHATAGAKAKHELTFQPDHPVGADHNDPGHVIFDSWHNHPIAPVEALWKQEGAQF
jgi:hypothetical protein